MSYRLFTPETPATPAFGRTWIVNAPWAHPLWSSYAFFLYDLTTEIKGEEPVIYLPGASHELLVYALDPKFKDDTPFHRLHPANHGYQFKAESNEAAEARIVAILEEIEAKRLSPDTDFRTMWDVRFADGVSLLNRGGDA